MENKYKDSKFTAVGWIRMQKNRTTGEFFYPISLADGTKGILKLNKEAMQAVKQDEALINKKVVGTIVVTKGEGGVLEDTINTKGAAAVRTASAPRAAAPRTAVSKPTSTDDIPF